LDAEASVAGSGQVGRWAGRQMAGSISLRGEGFMNTLLDFLIRLNPLIQVLTLIYNF
jgi:hypothetical protein